MERLDEAEQDIDNLIAKWEKSQMPLLTGVAVGNVAFMMGALLAHDKEEDALKFLHDLLDYSRKKFKVINKMRKEAKELDDEVQKSSK